MTALAPVPNTCVRCAVDIATDTGVHRVDAVRCSAWAVNLAHDGRSYALTHLPTGLRVPPRWGTFRDEDSAIAAMLAIAALGPDWPRLGAREIVAIRQSIIAVCLRHGGAGVMPFDAPPPAPPDVPATLNGYGGRA